MAPAAARPPPARPALRGHREDLKHPAPPANPRARAPQAAVAPIHLAAYHGHAACLSALLEHGADTSLTVQGGFSAVHVAAAKSHAGAVRTLLSAGERTPTPAKTCAGPKRRCACVLGAPLAVVIRDGAAWG